MDVDAVADELYRLDPSDFVAARTSFVQQARAAKDRAAAAAIAVLKKPTTVGWLVNLLAHERPDEVNGVLALGDALRQAQRRLDAETLRELTGQRQQLVRALARRAGALAGERGRSVSETALQQVSQTLNAAMVDSALAATVRQGRVIAAVSYSGFGPTGLESVDTGEDEESPDVDAEQAGPSARDRETVLEQARAELRAARADEQDARTALTQAETELARIHAEAAEADERIRDLRRELDHLEERVGFLARSEDTATQSVSSARDDVERAGRRATEAEGVVADLE